MKKNLIVTIFLVFMVLSIAAPGAYADPINLSSWSALTLNFAGGQGAGNWALESGNTAVTQTINADPSFYLNNVNQTSYTMKGSWQVLPAGGGDDDYMGFAFGYQNSSNFYLFDWKQGTQGYVGQTATEGMTIKKFTGATGIGLADLSLEEFWENQVNLGDMAILAANHSSTAGWVNNVLYDFQLDFAPGVIHVIVKRNIDGTELWNVTVNDSTFTSGQFGFYNNSQQSVRYAGFEQEGGVTVPEPLSMLLLGLGLAGLAGIRKTFRK